MYNPSSFAVSDLARLHDFMESNSFGLVISQSDNCPVASHLPLLLERSGGEHGTIVGHMARANSQWREMTGQQVLTIFSGPHAYISPTWYEAEQVVPTWNYVAVHAYGRVHLIEDPEPLFEIVRDTVTVYESSMSAPWQVDHSEFVERLMKQIVGFRIEIDRIEGKWKLNQNHPAERRAKVVRALQKLADENSRAIAALMDQTLGS